MKVLVINAGSSSVKYYLYQMPKAEVLARGLVERIGEETSKLSHFFRGKTYTLSTKAEDVEKAMELILKTLADKEVGVLRQISEIGAVGHRVVHGGEEFTGSVIIDEKVIASIEKFADLAPLHNPPNLVARRAAAIMGKGKYDINAITCHLGNGCSVTAVKNGRSIDTSMGLTPLEGVPMGTRSGDLDPAILFYLADKGYDAKALKTLCNKQSGLLGLSGISNDMRNLEEFARKGNARAKLAIDVFCYRIKKYIGAYAAVLDTVDAVVFTGGIGENSVFMREKICNAVTQIGVQLDYAANQTAIAKEAEINTKDSKVKVFVIPTNEQAAIANDTYELTRDKQPIVSKQNSSKNIAQEQMEIPNNRR